MATPSSRSARHGRHPITPKPCVLGAAPDAPTVVMSIPAAVRQLPADAPTLLRTRPAHVATTRRGSAPALPRARGSAPMLANDARPAGTPASNAAPASPGPGVASGAPVAPIARAVPPAPPEVFALLRRLALQRELTDAAAVLRAELGELVRARIVLVQVGPNRALSSPTPHDLRELAAIVRLDLVAETAARRQRFTAERFALIPVRSCTATVLAVWRAPSAPALAPHDVTLATQVASRLDILDHFVAVAHEQRRERAADEDSVFRAEALAAAREPRRDGQIIDLSPRVVRFALPALLAVVVVLVVLAAVLQVPTYSRGTIVIKTNGSNVIANTGGRIARVLVAPGQRVAAGQALVVLDTTQEQQQVDQVDAVYRDQLSTFLFDTTDDAARESLAGILAQRTASRDALGAKTIVSPIDGAISDVLVADLVQPGEHVATIIPDDTAPSVLAFMPGSDRSRIQPGMTLQVELTGYGGMRLELPITEVGTEIMGAAKARRFLGDKLADAVALPPSVVLVRATLPSKSFESRGKTYGFFDGMDGLGEVAIDTRSFLSTVLPLGD